MAAMWRRLCLNATLLLTTTGALGCRYLFSIFSYTVPSPHRHTWPPVQPADACITTAFGSQPSVFLPVVAVDPCGCAVAVACAPSANATDAAIIILPLHSNYTVSIPPLYSPINWQPHQLYPKPTQPFVLLNSGLLLLLGTPLANQGAGGVSVFSAPPPKHGMWTEVMQLLPPSLSQGMGMSIAHGNSVLLVGGHNPSTQSAGSVLFYYTRFPLLEFTPVLAYSDETNMSQFGAAVAVDSADTAAWVTFVIGAPGVFGKTYVGAVLRPGVTPSLDADSRAFVIARYVHANFLNTAFRNAAKSTDAFGAAVAVGRGAVASTLPFYRYSSGTTVLDGLILYLSLQCPPDTYQAVFPPKNQRFCLPCSNGTRSDGFGWTLCAACTLPAADAVVVWGYRLVLLTFASQNPSMRFVSFLRLQMRVQVLI